MKLLHKNLITSETEKYNYPPHSIPKDTIGHERNYFHPGNVEKKENHWSNNLLQFII